MNFSFYTYFLNNLALPLFAIAFICVPMGKLIYTFLRSYFVDKQVDTSNLVQKLLFSLALLVLLVLMIYMLSQGGIHLIYEWPSKAVCSEGIIEEITALNSLHGMKYDYDGVSSYGYEFTINGETLVGMAIGDLETGDTVTYTYLPNSGYILTIEEVE